MFTKEQQSQVKQNVDRATRVTKDPALTALGESYILEEATLVKDSEGKVVELPPGTPIQRL